MCDSWGYGYAGALRVMLEGVPCLYAYGCVYVGAGVRRSCADDALAYGEVEEGFVYICAARILKSGRSRNATGIQWRPVQLFAQSLPVAVSESTGVE